MRKTHLRDRLEKAALHVLPGMQRQAVRVEGAQERIEHLQYCQFIDHFSSCRRCRHLYWLSCLFSFQNIILYYLQ